MMEIALPRIQLALPPLERLLLVGVKAEEHLKYRILSARIRDFELLRVLDSVQALPFDPTAVEAYKRKMRAESNGPWYRFAPLSEARNHWFETPLEEYTGAVPLTVLDKALEIKAQSRDAYFGVDYLAPERKEMRRDLDPFLMVRVSRYSGPWHHIAVWDEPGFGF